MLSIQSSTIFLVKIHIIKSIWGLLVRLNNKSQTIQQAYIFLLC